MLQKAVPFECKVDMDERTIEGYASIIGNVDLGGDRVLSGAFKKTIADRFTGKTPPLVKMLWQHYAPLGLPIMLAEDKHGLQFKARVSQTVLGDEALTLMHDGVVSQMSFGYDAVLWDLVEEDGKKICNLKEIKLYEISPITFPMNEETAITAVRKMIEGAPIGHAAKGLLMLAARLGVKTIGEEGGGDDSEGASAADLIGGFDERMSSLTDDFEKLRSMIADQSGEVSTDQSQPGEVSTDSESAMTDVLEQLKQIRQRFTKGT